MIAKHIHSSSRGSFRSLALYIANAEEKGEKLENLWTLNCRFADGEGSLGHVIAEIEATQGLNQMAAHDRNYHLMLSFRDEKPSYETLVEIERRFADELGLTEHQRVAASHANTGNFHIHVAYNLIHPRDHTISIPFRDYRTLERTSRSVEEQYGLKRDKGRSDYAGGHRAIPDRARSKEIRTWETSFSRYVRDRAGELAESLGWRTSWMDFHHMIGQYGLLIVPSGRGLAIRDYRDIGCFTKASILGREFGKPALEERFGPFDPTRVEQAMGEKGRYGWKPLTEHPDQHRLWRTYVEVKSKGGSSADSVYASWRKFLETTAAHDPLAADIVRRHNRENPRPSRKKGMSI